MRLTDLVWISYLLFLSYAVALNAAYLGLNLSSLFALLTHARRREMDQLRLGYSGLEPPISVLAPAYNEIATIEASVRSFLQVEYAEFEVIVINDGSTDGTFEVLREAFALIPSPEPYRRTLPTQAVKGIYRSTVFPTLRVIDKENGGKADALNAGINCSRYPLYAAVDADSILQPDSLDRIVRPFLEDPSTVAVGGCIRVANGCRVQDGFLVHVGLPRKLLVLFQLAEYMRAFMSGRLGWSTFNGLLIISGAFGVFNKARVTEAGGYQAGNLGEDMELVVRLHRQEIAARRKYRIVFVPDPICWTEVPEDLRSLKSQRTRWQRGLGQSLMLNLGLFFAPRAGVAGRVALPFMFIFEWLGPLIELGGYAFVSLCWLGGQLSAYAFGLYFLVSVGMGVMLSVSSLLLEELAFHLYPRFRDLAVLFAVVVIENFGYRQLVTWWRLEALIQALVGGQTSWGKVRRSGAWSADPAPDASPPAADVSRSAAAVKATGSSGPGDSHRS